MAEVARVASGSVPPPAAHAGTVAELITSTHAVRADTPIAEVVRLFERVPEADSVAITGESQLRIVVRARFFLQLGKRFGYSLFENRPVRLLAEEGSTVESEADPVEAVALALAREPVRIYDDLLVTRAGRYVGTVALRQLLAHHKDLLQASMVENSELDRRNRQLAELNRSQNDFVANMTHELRSPLNTMLGLARLLVDQAALAEPARGWIETLAARGRELQAIVDNVLDLARLESGGLEPLYEPVHLIPLCEELLRDTEALVGARPVNVTMKLEHLPERFVSDPVLLRRILTNLLSNAAKFTERGSIVLGAGGDGRVVRFHVTDTGTGIAPADVPRLFQRFTQLESTRTKRHSGTGLGLAIVKGLVERLNGTIVAQSLLGAGTTFTVRVPDARSPYGEPR